MRYFGDAVILCGGKSERMDMDKSFVKIGGRYMIDIICGRLSECFDNIRLCADSKERLNGFGLEVIEDIVVSRANGRAHGGAEGNAVDQNKIATKDRGNDRIGPAVGIYTALTHATSKYVFMTACDMPLVDPSHIEFMKRALEYHAYLPDALVPMNGRYIEPLYSFYSADMADMMEEEIRAGNYKIHRILDKCNTLYLEDHYSRIFDEELAMFTNINYAADLDKFS